MSCVINAGTQWPPNPPPDQITSQILHDSDPINWPWGLWRSSRSALRRGPAMSSNTMLAVPVKNAIASLDLKQAVTSYLASSFSRETAAQAAPSLSEAQARGISAPGHACMQHQFLAR